MKKQLLYILLILITRVYVSNAQWESMNGPYGGHIHDLDRNTTYQFAATHDGLYRSTDASTWTKLHFVPGRHHSCVGIAVMDSIVIANTNYMGSRQFFRSTTNGETWTEISVSPDALIPRLHITPHGLYADDLYDFWYSPDNGQSWAASSLPIPHDQTFISIVSNNDVWTGSTGAIWRSNSNDASWTKIPIPLESAQIHQLFVHDSVILALASYNERLYRSPDLGQTWTWEAHPRWNAYEYISFAVVDSIYFASFGDSIMRSEDAGQTWMPAASRFYATGEEMITYDTSLLFAGRNQGVIRSDDFGESCYSSSFGITAADVSQVALYNDEVIAASNYHGIFNTASPGQAWQRDYDDTLFNEYIVDLIAFDTSLFAIAPSLHTQVYRYGETDQQWALETPAADTRFSRFSIFDDSLYVQFEAGLEQWNPATATWQLFSFETGSEVIFPRFLVKNEGYAFAGAGTQLFRKQLTIGTWEPILLTDTLDILPYNSIEDIQTIGDKVFLTILTRPNGDINAYRILASSDNGLTWEFAEANFPQLELPWWNRLAPLHNFADAIVTHAIGYNTGIVVSGTEHVDWKSFNDGLPGTFINDMAADETYLYAATSNHGVWRRPLADLIITSVTALATSKVLEVFPNPSNGSFSFSIDLENDEQAVLLVSDASGKIWHKQTQTVKDGINSVFVPGNVPGLHFMTLITRYGMVTCKLILQ